MNILFFLTPKSEVAYISEEDTLRQALEKDGAPQIFCHPHYQQDRPLYRNSDRRRSALGHQKPVPSGSEKERRRSPLQPSSADWTTVR